MKTVYLAGPYTKPHQIDNIRKAILAADEVLALGFAPFCPHLSGFWDCISPKPYETWLQLDLEWVARCDYLIRLPGESSGADGEVYRAALLGIPVFHGVEAFRKAGIEP